MPINDFYIAEEEVKTAVNHLKKNKSRDPFELKAEHYIYALGDHFTSYLTRLINNIFASNDIPPSLSISIIIPLVKSHKKSINDPNNYRGISLIPIITKILEIVVLNKCPQMKNHSSSQFGFVSNSSSLHAEILLQDTISYYNNNDSPVYVCSLDAEKAFDSCNWYSLFNKLLQKERLSKHNRQISDQALSEQYSIGSI